MATEQQPDLESGRSARLWTPERVPLTLPLAGLGERSVSYLIDLSLLVLLFFAAFLLYNTVARGDVAADVGNLSGTALFLLALALFAVAVLSDVICEVAFNGRTLGKRLVRLRVLRSNGRPPDFFTSLLRNALRIIDYLPFGYAVGTVAMFLTGTRRIGDLVADTFVVTERSRQKNPIAIVREAAGAGVDVGGLMRRTWSDADALRALSMLERTAGLDQKTAQLLCKRLLDKLDPALAHAPEAATSARALLAAGALTLVEARAGALGAIQELVDVEAALHVALQDLDRTRTRAADAADAIPPEVERADQAIRKAASELMRAERRNVPARHRESLSLALLEAERRRVVKEPAGKAVRRFFLSEVPATVWEERGLVARAAAVLVIGLVVGGAVAYADAGVARFLISADVAQRVEEGASWTDAIERNGSFAQASAQIIVNNVFVGLRVFAMGLLGGVATILGLLSNGLSIGATFGYALRLGTAGTLLRFICAHGPVELTMVCVSGAAGMCLGRALLSPGRRTRMHALREEGARGIRLVVAASMGFMMIGTVEGFISPGRMFPTPVNLALGLTLLAIFWLWVRAFGRPHAPDLPLPLPMPMPMHSRVPLP